MPDVAELYAFWGLALILLFCAAAVVMARNPIYAAMALVGAFFTLAGIYIILTAHLIAFLQIIVYAGAIMVLFVFVIMLLSLTDDEIGHSRYTAMKFAGAAGAAGVGGVIFWAIRETAFDGLAAGATDPAFGTVRAIGRMLFTDYLLPFEAVSILLLVAIVGAVVVAKQKI
jgi:NADH-quinone oxidoreductase subunit J